VFFVSSSTTVFVKPFASKCPLMSERRASMVAAFLAGVSILRDVIGTPALQKSGSDRELMALVSQIVEFIMNEDKECQTMRADRADHSGDIMND
jgi:hypothetical protein